LLGFFGQAIFGFCQPQAADDTVGRLRLRVELHNA